MFFDAVSSALFPGSTARIDSSSCAFCDLVGAPTLAHEPPVTDGDMVALELALQFNPQPVQLIECAADDPRHLAWRPGDRSIDPLITEQAEVGAESFVAHGLGVGQEVSSIEGEPRFLRAHW